MAKIKSSMIKEADWKDGVLTITFNSGKRFSYPDVEEEVWKNFQKAESAGKFFHEQLRARECFECKNKP